MEGETVPGIHPQHYTVIQLTSPWCQSARKPREKLRVSTKSWIFALVASSKFEYRLCPEVKLVSPALSQHGHAL